MKRVRIISVGRLKTPHWREAARHYRERLSKSLRLEELAAKDADPALPPEKRKEQEAQRLLKLLRPSDTVICLDEGGPALTSAQFARFLQELHDTGQTPCFVVGGAYGLGPDILNAAAKTLSFGPMTLPHELAQVLLLEQLYRAEAINAGSGYHH